MTRRRTVAGDLAALDRLNAKLARKAKKAGVPGDGGQLCHVCNRIAAEGRHPCRFEVACSCWRGEPCDGSGRIGRRAQR